MREPDVLIAGPLDHISFANATQPSRRLSEQSKGGEGLGKREAKRHRKVLRDNIQGIIIPAIRRLARRGGVKRTSGLIYEETSGVVKVFLENVIHDAVIVFRAAARSRRRATAAAAPAALLAIVTHSEATPFAGVHFTANVRRTTPVRWTGIVVAYSLRETVARGYNEYTLVW
ncbi:unnamed protein product [Heligmosomoides polygyrus]|uniref:Histone H4 n=1 Tax=Heligmosomoides polygyrus TaxID=6339 RepID=A0A183GGK5_HELPZ|nr:unnamed protein product [Heligmosomoides polygyrus]